MLRSHITSRYGQNSFYRVWTNLVPWASFYSWVGPIWNFNMVSKYILDLLLSIHIYPYSRCHAMCVTRCVEIPYWLESRDMVKVVLIRLGHYSPPELAFVFELGVTQIRIINNVKVWSGSIIVDGSLVIAHEVLFTLFSHSINKVVSVYFTISSLYGMSCLFLRSVFAVAILE